MIQLFNVPSYKIDTGEFTSLLHDNIVKEFEEKFAEYVGAKYAVSVNSATNAIFLTMLLEQRYFKKYVAPRNSEAVLDITIPSILPPVVANAILHSGCSIRFNDNIWWVGDSYVLYESGRGYKIIDSAQKVEKNQFKAEAKGNDLMIFSFYPTKPVGSCDGGMIVSNDRKKIEEIRTLTFNGMSFSQNNWERKQTEVGYKMYMNSIQAYTAMQNLLKLEEKQGKLKKIRDIYNLEFGLSNTSDHLYRVTVPNNNKVVKIAKKAGIVCGIHYHALHKSKVFEGCCRYPIADPLLESEQEHKTTMSIPFHEALSKKDIVTVVKFVKKHIACYPL